MKKKPLLNLKSSSSTSFSSEVPNQQHINNENFEEKFGSKQKVESFLISAGKNGREGTSLHLYFFASKK